MNWNTKLDKKKIGTIKLLIEKINTVDDQKIDFAETFTIPDENWIMCTSKMHIIDVNDVRIDDEEILENFAPTIYNKF